VRNFAINTNVNQLISPNLAWRQRELAFVDAFQGNHEKVLAVIDSSTSERATAASKALARPSRSASCRERRLGIILHHHYIRASRLVVWSCDMALRPRDLASRMAGRRKPDDGYLRETFTLPRDQARSRARDFLSRYPKAAYMSAVESWRELPDGEIEFTMRRLASAD